MYPNFYIFESLNLLMYFILIKGYNNKVRKYTLMINREKIKKSKNVRIIATYLLRGCTIMKHLAKVKTHCSCCGRVIYKNGTTDEVSSKEVWNYFSTNLGGNISRHNFHMCKQCYEKLISNFEVPTEEYMIDDMPMYTEEEIELLNAAYARELVCK